jgi:hypothetical protein
MLQKTFFISRSLGMHQMVGDQIMHWLNMGCAFKKAFLETPCSINALSYHFIGLVG